MTVVTRWFDGLISKDIDITNEIYSLREVDFDRQVSWLKTMLVVICLKSANPIIYSFIFAAAITQQYILPVPSLMLLSTPTFSCTTILKFFPKNAHVHRLVTSSTSA